ncbi:MAG: AzlD domain-containing protein [Firmicutes bacterium]|nr:AzlD domain-containing protein [Bacillota bacterium]
MAVVTYIVRTLPFIVFKNKIKSRFLNSVLFYIPYGVLSAMTFPSVFYSTGEKSSAIAGTCVAVALALGKKSLLFVAVAASLTVLAVKIFLLYMG